ncbi:MAG: endonuclease [Halobacteriovoraceae bacterium]|nr:endonuclease [Halobacteriovoraceae bacterium]
MKTLTLLVFLFNLQAFADISYYPTDYQQAFQRNAFQNEVLKDKLFILMASVHSYKSGRNDTISNHCSGTGKCYEHRSIGYKGARKVLFGKIHLKEDSQGYFLKDVYCRKKITRQVTHIGPNIIPANGIVNCEHTWPQSKFSRTFSKGLQKSDLHHLYPTDSRANSTRGNNEFAEVDGDKLDNCDGSYIGAEKWQGAYFEPPNEHKGNVARALFYFAVRYKMKISSLQERYLRRWHQLDPVDHDEEMRNELIQKVQGNRNPFIDYPELVGQISDF